MSPSSILLDSFAGFSPAPSMLICHRASGGLGLPLSSVSGPGPPAGSKLLTHPAGVELVSAARRTTPSVLVAALPVIVTEHACSGAAGLSMTSVSRLCTPAWKEPSATHFGAPPCGFGGAAVKPAPASERSASWLEYSLGSPSPGSYSSPPSGSCSEIRKSIGVRPAGLVKPAPCGGSRTRRGPVRPRRWSRC